MKPQATKRTCYGVNVQYTVCTARGNRALYQYDVLAVPASASHPGLYIYMCMYEWRFAKDAPFAEGNCFKKQFVYINIQALCIDVSGKYCTNMLIIGWKDYCTVSQHSQVGCFVCLCTMPFGFRVVFRWKLDQSSRPATNEL